MGYSEKGKQGFQSTHCLSSHPLYKTWKSIKNRCYNPNSKDYKDYGNRGISMYEEWENDFVEFLYWALKNGWEKGLTIERKDLLNDRANLTHRSTKLTSKFERIGNFRAVKMGV